MYNEINEAMRLAELRETSARGGAPLRRLRPPPLHSVGRRTSRRCHTTLLPVLRCFYFEFFCYVFFFFANGNLESFRRLTIRQFSVAISNQLEIGELIGKKIHLERKNCVEYCGVVDVVDCGGCGGEQSVAGISLCEC